jgi:hypothetical protein
MACVVRGCTDHTNAKALMCAKHWYALPLSLRDDARRGTEKGAHTLRVHPTREWLSTASKYVGDIKNLYISVGVDSRIRRKFQDTKPQDEPTASVV